MSDVNTDKKLKGKDLITIGIFSAIYFVINFAFMLLSGIHPALWMLMPGLIAVFAGIPFMLMVAKVQSVLPFPHLAFPTRAFCTLTNTPAR